MINEQIDAIPWSYCELSSRLEWSIACFFSSGGMFRGTRQWLVAGTIMKGREPKQLSKTELFDPIFGDCSVLLFPITKSQKWPFKIPTQDILKESIFFSLGNSKLWRSSRYTDSVSTPQGASRFTIHITLLQAEFWRPHATRWTSRLN